MVGTKVPSDEHTYLLPTHSNVSHSEKLLVSTNLSKVSHDICDTSSESSSTSRLVKRLLFWVMVAVASAVILYFGDPSTSSQDARTYSHLLSPKPVTSDDYDAGAPFAPLKIQRLWASYAPYYSVERYQPPPKDCRLNQVNILQRHAARYPTAGYAFKIAQALAKLQAADSYSDPKFQFLVDYNYDLGVDDITPFGELENTESGRKSSVRYSTVVNKTNLPFVRASGGKRVIDSANQWIKGFSVGTDNVLQPKLAVIIPEIKGYNNTLRDHSCPKHQHSSDKPEEWQNIYARPIADRLNTIAQGLLEDLTSGDAEALIALCALETVAKREYSQFCDLFEDKEFEGFEYSIDLDKFYFTGHGSRLGAVQGVGYINELLARLTHHPVHDHTQTNTTLDSDSKTFPLDRGLYADFSHDNLIVAVVSSMGLFKDKHGMLNPKKPHRSRAWFISRIVPFSAKLVVERMECGLIYDEGDAVISATGRGRQERDRQYRRMEDPEDFMYVRVLMNDAVQDLKFCEGQDGDKLCPLRAFVESQVYAREMGEGDWERCFE